MKRLLIGLLVIVFSSPVFSSVNYSKKSANGVALHILEINFSSEKIIPVSAKGMDYVSRYYTDESFVSMAKRVNAVGAINGCYFDKTTLKPIGDVAVKGERLHNGGGWAYFGIKSDGTYEFGTDNPVQSRVDWSDFQWGITCLPMIIRDGTVLINSKEDLTSAGFRDSHVFMKMPRSALGETKNGKIVLAASGNTTFPAFAKALKSIGIVNAIGLDGGASTALYYAGKTILPAGRKLTTILAIVKGGAETTLKKEKSVEMEDVTNSAPENKTETAPAETLGTEEAPSPSSQPAEMECQEQWFKDTPLSCENCKMIIKALQDQNESAMVSCITSLCKKKFPDCK